MPPRRDGIRDDYVPGRHDPWTGEELPSHKRWTPETFEPPRGIPDKGVRGIRSSHEHAEADSPGWTEQAASALRDYASRHGEFTIEEARSSVTARVGEPEELRAWGAVTLYAQRRKWIEKTGAYRSAVSSNGSPKPVYRAGASA